MKHKIIYLGDTALDRQASYLTGVMRYYDLSFDYVNSDEKFSDALLEQDYQLMILSDYYAYLVSERYRIKPFIVQAGYRDYSFLIPRLDGFVGRFVRG